MRYKQANESMAPINGPNTEAKSSPVKKFNDWKSCMKTRLADSNFRPLAADRLPPETKYFSVSVEAKELGLGDSEMEDLTAWMKEQVFGLSIDAVYLSAGRIFCRFVLKALFSSIIGVKPSRWQSISSPP